MQAITYHVHDFVYIRKGASGISDIAQVASLRLHDTSSYLDVYPLLRYEDIANESEILDYRNLVSVMFSVQFLLIGPPEMSIS